MKKKRQFSGSVRQVCSNTNKPVFEFSSEHGSVIQSESFLERILRSERDSTIKQYLSQPLFISYEDRRGAKKKYKLDYKVIRGNNNHAEAPTSWQCTSDPIARD